MKNTFLQLLLILLMGSLLVMLLGRQLNQFWFIHLFLLLLLVCSWHRYQRFLLSCFSMCFSVGQLLNKFWWKRKSQQIFKSSYNTCFSLLQFIFIRQEPFLLLLVSLLFTITFFSWIINVTNINFRYFGKYWNARRRKWMLPVILSSCTAVLNLLKFWSPGDIYQCLETFLVVTI